MGWQVQKLLTFENMDLLHPAPYSLWGAYDLYHCLTYSSVPNKRGPPFIHFRDFQTPYIFFDLTLKKPHFW